MKSALAAAALVLAAATPAHAYIDPGTGTIILQAIMGSLVAASLFFRQLREKVTSLFRRKDRATEKREED